MHLGNNVEKEDLKNVVIDVSSYLNPLPNNKFLDWSKLKAIAYNRTQEFDIL